MIPKKHQANFMSTYSWASGHVLLSRSPLYVNDKQDVCRKRPEAAKRWNTRMYIYYILQLVVVHRLNHSYNTPISESSVDAIRNEGKLNSSTCGVAFREPK